MKIITKKQIIIINVLLHKIGQARGEAVSAGEKAVLMLDATLGRTDTTTGLFQKEAASLILVLQRAANSAWTPSERMRRHVISIAHEMGWEQSNGAVDMGRLNNWCVKYGQFHKKLNEHTEEELKLLVKQFKSVQRATLKSI